MTAGVGFPTWFDYITLLAIVAGPVLALWIQRVLDKWRDKRRAKESLYFALMRHRAQWYHPERIQALNSIEVVFSDNKNVLSKWKSFMEHVKTAKPAASDQLALAVWNDNLDTVACDLYQAIGKTLNYDFDLKQIKQGAYIPSCSPTSMKHR